MSETDDRLRRHWLGAAAKAELTRVKPRLALPQPLREQYETDRASRSRDMRRMTYTGAAAFVAIVLLLNIVVVGRPNWRLVGLLVTITPAMSVAIAGLFYRAEMPALVRETAGMVNCSIYSLAVILTNFGSPAEFLLPNLFLSTLPVIYVLFFLRPPLAAAIGFTACSALCLGVVLVLRHDLPPGLRLYPMGFLIAAAAPTLVGVYRLQLASQQSYLYRLTQDLQIAELSDQNARLSELSATDPVTGAASRRRLDLALAELCAMPTTGSFLLLVDLDHFKAFNDRHGHLAGDACLREVVIAMRVRLRRSDLVARFGGEEFAIVLTGTDAQQAMAVAETVRESVAGHDVLGGAKPVRVTISIGIAERQPGMNMNQLIAAADLALYEAKNDGRDCVRLAAVPAIAPEL